MQVSYSEGVSFLIKKRLFVLFLISYIGVACLPMGAMLGLYYSEISRGVEGNLIAQMENESVTAAVVLDSHLSIISKLPHQLYNDRDVLAYKNTGDTLKRGHVIELLQKIIGANDLIEDIYLYFRERETFISAYCNSYDADSMRLFGPKNALFYPNLPYDELFDRLEHQYGAAILPVQQVKTGASATQPILTFVETLPQNNKYAYATMLTLVNVAELEKIMGRDHTVTHLLLRPDGAVVLGEAPNGANTQKYIHIAQSTSRGAQKTTIDGTDYILSWAKSEESGWTILEFNTVDLLLERMRDIHLRILAAVSILSLLLSFLIFLFMRKTYTPVGNLYAVASNVGKNSGEQNAFDLIEHTINTLHRQNSQLQTQLSNQSSFMMQRTARLLISLPRSEWTDQRMDEGRRNGLCMDYSSYQILILQFQEPVDWQQQKG